ncbi:uncharacterized protein LOC127410774 [Myxocyprinus asiaticus]|uniref:uncharacterized protein LOC127410774 n=1 Tax=Myxocyprinus asiaticus TaxID=70543 RepID=UPI002223BE8C|nr:uncharacterized protein LOC127410774 [Myxocyprinus asiaticus]
MQRATTGSFDVDPQFKDELHHFPHPPSSSFSSRVTGAAPAKRITFYKSGDAKFKGVKMAIHKRSFKCFDALLDDLSQKVPLPFGVRTITTPRGTHSIKHLEQLEDGGCYLCSDRRYVKPINMEAAGKRPAVWQHHSHHHKSHRKPSRPEEAPLGHQHYHRHPKRILLVKNNDPAVRRSIILSRRTTRSLRVFMEEISELMQCHVKKLYTLEGRKIDSIQCLMQCPSVLVCVGREPFRPLLTESTKKLSEERLPGMGTRSQSSICSEGHESKKNVNFGLETKKSIIHPRSDSSNRSTRFSLSSEKSYQNGLCVTPEQSGCVSAYPFVKELVVNDDIEKRVLVNKDGSLSVEMKVRFRLFNDETLQWSTEIKKSSTKLYDSGSVKDGEPHYLQAKAKYSDPDSISPSETEEAFVTKLHQKHVEESHSQNCCNHYQEYDIWKNPMHKDQAACKSLSSSGSSREIVHKKSSVDSMQTISHTSEEYTEHMLEKASCFKQTMAEGDTRVEYCAISRCCSRSEVSTSAVNSKSSPAKSKCSHTDIREPNAGKSPKPHQEATKVMEERPISVVSSSSKVFESFKEDRDDDYDDLLSSISRASHWSQSDHLEHDDQFKCIHCCGCQASQRSYLSPRPPSKGSSGVVHSLKLKKYNNSFTAPVDGDGLVNHTERAKSMTSIASKVSSRYHECHCGAKTPSSVPSGHSQASLKSRGQTNIPGSNAPDALEICKDEKEQVNRSQSAMSGNSGLSRRSGKSGVCSHCGECKRLSGNLERTDALVAEKKVGSILSNKSEKLVSHAHKNCEPVNNNTSEEETKEEHSESALSKTSNASATSKKSNNSAHERSSIGKSEHNEVEIANKERSKSAMSIASTKSTKSEPDCIVSEREPTPTSSLSERGKAEKQSQARAVSPISANISAAFRISHKPNPAHSERARTLRSCSSDDLEEVPSKLVNSQDDEPESAPTQKYATSENHCGKDKELTREVRSASAMSNKSNPSSKHSSHASKETKRSVKCCCMLLETSTTQESSASKVQCEQENEVNAKERLVSSESICSKTSINSDVSSKHSSMPKNDKVSVAESNTSSRPCRSHKSSQSIPETTVTSVPNAEKQCDDSTQEILESKRATNTMSKVSEVSGKACSERSIKSGSNTTEEENGKDMTMNALTVTSPLPRSQRSPSPSRPKPTHITEVKETTSRAPSELSVNSNVSSKCCCHSSNFNDLKPKTQREDVNDESEERVASSLSGKSKLSAKSHMNIIKSSCNQLDELLSPTSTASVSLGLGEELKCDDFDERSTSGMSATTEDSGHKMEIVNCVDVEERSKMAASVNSANSESKLQKSHHSNCKTPVQALSPVSAKSVISAEFKKRKSGSGLNENNIRVPSALSVSSSRSKSPSRVLQGSAKNTAAKGSERSCEAVNDTSQAEMTEMDNASNKMSGTSSKHEQSERASGKATEVNKSSKASKHSVRSKNDRITCKNERRSKCSSQCLEINGLNIKCDSDNDGGNVKSLQTSKPDTISVKKVTSRPNSVVLSDISQNCQIYNKNKESVINPGSSSESALSQALSAADLLREIVGNVRPVSRESKSITSSKNVGKVEKMNDNESEKSSQYKHRKVSKSSERNKEEYFSELMPSCLPNASPTEVVNDWLRNIPTDGPVYEMDVELTESITQTPGDEETSQPDKREPPENIIEVEEPHEENQEKNNVSCVEKQVCEEGPQIETSKMDPNPQTLTKKEDLQKLCHSSVQVMKVLLSPNLGRCNSLPEVSAVYGRKLSQSAQGLLDCLANLRLIDSDPKNEKHPKYNEVMMILQSLWLQEPSENKQDIKEHPSAEDEFNPRSSSGVDVSSCSTGSVKGSVGGIIEKSETVQGKIPPIAEQEASLQDKDEVVMDEDEEKPTTASCEGLDPSNVVSELVTPDIAERVQVSPENTEMDDDNQEKTVLTPVTKEDSQNTENKNESDQTPLTSFNKSSGKESSIKSLENTSSGTPPSVQRASLTKRVSQDPDPIWVLSLLKKLEKQFMLHYTDAMAEFKVWWDLDDNEMLNMMITELKEEVHKRIQSSINRELQKIQSRAGRGPRPPKNALSRESTVQTEQRRKRLRVMRNKSISLSRSDENYTASGTDYSEDEYCPCDACMKKKMASRAAQRTQALSLAPILREFDLRNILQMKKNPAKPPERKMEEQSTANTGNTEENNLEVLHEELEEVNDKRGHDNEAEEGDFEEEADKKEAEDHENVQDVSVDHKTKDEVETNDKRESGDEDDGEEGEGERVKEEEENRDVEFEEKEEIVVDGKADTDEEELGEAEHGETVEKEAEKEGNATEENGVEKDGPEGDIAEVGDAENSNTAEDEDKLENTETIITGEETESGEEGKAPEDAEVEETETGEEVNVERSDEDQPTADGGQSQFDKDESSEGEKSDQNEPPNEESTNEKNASGNHAGSAEEGTVEDRK